MKQRNAANSAWITVMLLATARMSNSDACDGFHASQTPAANQIPVLNSAGRLVLDGADDGSSKIQTGGVIKAGGLKLSDTNEIKWGDGSCKISGSGSTDIITLTGNLSIKNIYGAGLAVNNYSGANSIGENIWIGGGGTSSIGESGATYKGSGNFAAGTSALYFATTAYWNTASGYASLYGITIGHANTAVGYAAGRFIAGGSVLNTISTGSLYLGAATKAGADGNTNEIVIGFNATGMGSNSVTLGNASITKTILRGNTLIRTTIDNDVDALQVNGSIIAASTEKSIKLDPTTNLPAITITSADLGQVHLYMGGASNPATAGISFSDNARKLWFRTESTERLAILQSGRILAGPILPTDNGVDALQVNGTIASTGYKLSALNTAPASASATGTLGEIRITADAVYICTATNTWKKVAIATW
ncbi:MAG: hypothetical protein PHV68_09135 [Candidatus Gastranaerophilales bacterium]|nr:hypothetical protein [Candidatus Gastranaerophilales bacterium]